jgi:hypothetical protein
MSLRLTRQRASNNLASSTNETPVKCSASVKRWSAKKAVLLSFPHNEIRDELVDLASKDFSPSAVRDKPKIHSCRANEGELPEGRQDQPVKRLFRNSRNEDRGDVLIQGLWSNGGDCILDVRMTDLDVKSNKSRNPGKV